MENPVHENQTEVKQNRKNSEAFLKEDVVRANRRQNQKCSRASEVQTNYASLGCSLRYFNMYVLNNPYSMTVAAQSQRTSDFETYEMTRLDTLQKYHDKRSDDCVNTLNQTPHSHLAIQTLSLNT